MSVVLVVVESGRFCVRRACAIGCVEKFRMANVQVVSDLVAFLLENKFENLSYDDKKYVKESGRPRPALDNLINHTNTGNRKFCNTWYDKCEWLTGSESKNKLFCWPCLLFGNATKSSPWKSTGVDNLKALYKSIEKHNISKEHTYASLKLKLFGRQNIQNTLDSAHRITIIKHNEKVKENREMMNRLIDMTIYLASQELAFRGHDDGSCRTLHI